MCVCVFFLKFLTWGRPTHDTHHIKTTRQENSWRITTLTVSQLIVIANLGAWRIRTSVNQRGPMARETRTEWQASKWLKLIFTFHLGVSSPSGHQLAQSTGCRWPFVHVNVLLRRRPRCVPCSTHTHTHTVDSIVFAFPQFFYFFLSLFFVPQLRSHFSRNAKRKRNTVVVVKKNRKITRWWTIWEGNNQRLERPSKGVRERERKKKQSKDEKAIDFICKRLFFFFFSLFLGNISSHPVGFTTSESVGRWRRKKKKNKPFS